MSSPADLGDMGDQPVARCAFCNRSAERVEQLIAGPNRVYICNDCVEICNQILAEQRNLQRERNQKPRNHS